MSSPMPGVRHLLPFQRFCYFLVYRLHLPSVAAALRWFVMHHVERSLLYRPYEGIEFTDSWGYRGWYESSRFGVFCFVTREGREQYRW